MKKKIKMAITFDIEMPKGAIMLPKQELSNALDYIQALDFYYKK